MGARSAKSSTACCCTASEHKANETFGGDKKPSKEPRGPLWEEEQVVTDARLFGQIQEVQTKPSPGGRGKQRLDFFLDGSGAEFGLELMVLPEPDPPVVVVSQVECQGQLAKTRSGCPGLCPGDTVLDVGGRGIHQSVDAIFDAFRRLRTAPAGGVVISARLRPLSFIASITRRGDRWRRLGLAIALRPKEGVLLVASVDTVGLVHQWNTANNKHCICVGDRIVAVNGCANDAYGTYQLIQATSLGGHLQMRIEPPPRDRAAAAQAWAKQALRPEAEEVLETI